MNQHDWLSPCRHHGTHEHDALPLRQRSHRPILNHDGRRRLPVARAKIDDPGCFLSTVNILANTTRGLANLFVVEDSHRDLGRHSLRPLSEERWTLSKRHFWHHVVRSLSILTASSPVRSRCASSYYPTAFATSRIGPRRDRLLE
ncbi:hypothetical protein BDZ89DRAFT_50546 [Hymenopellis radicata]|nr:hypothetical protein BDZ89DRAFT_50546 [Hymenopellis radicata]